MRADCFGLGDGEMINKPSLGCAPSRGMSFARTILARRNSSCSKPGGYRDVADEARRVQGKANDRPLPFRGSGAG